MSKKLEMLASDHALHRIGRISAMSTRIVRSLMIPAAINILAIAFMMGLAMMMRPG